MESQLEKSHGRKAKTGAVSENSNEHDDTTLKAESYCNACLQTFSIEQNKKDNQFEFNTNRTTNKSRLEHNEWCFLQLSTLLLNKEVWSLSIWGWIYDNSTKYCDFWTDFLQEVGEAHHVVLAPIDRDCSCNIGQGLRYRPRYTSSRLVRAMR